MQGPVRSIDLRARIAQQLINVPSSARDLAIGALTSYHTARVALASAQGVTATLG